MRNKYKYSLDNKTEFVEKMIFFTKEFSYSCILHSNSSNLNSPKKYYQFDLLCAFDSIQNLYSSKNSLKKLQSLHNKKNDWLFGYISYDLKNEIFNIKSDNISTFDNDNINFFIPKHVIIIKGNNLIIESIEKESKVVEFLNQIHNYHFEKEDLKKINFLSRESRASYLEKINHIKNHIQRGDIYEMNFCQEFYKEDVEISPQNLFYTLNNLTQSPFATFLNLNTFNVIGASPERFLLKEGNEIISQPIKGTSRRGLNTQEDVLLAKKLSQSSKDISENTMIVDLVRNDLSITAKLASVKVEKLCGVYTFSHVHQMISTISSTLKEKNNFVDVLSTTFPMGSMTGAPKIKAMQLIEKYEESKRDVYSGSVGYITPKGDFDFNVIIRSLLYDSQKKHLSFTVGGAIVSKSEAINEYEECLIKAKPIFQIFS